MNSISMMGASASLYIWMIVLAVVIIAISIFVGLVPVGVWFKSMISGVYIGAFKLAGMKMRKVDVALIANYYVNAKKAGIEISLEKLERHLKAGGNIVKVVDSLIVAGGAGIELSFENAATMDLANEDVLAIVKANINPTIVNTDPIHAVALDGIELIVSARITLKADLNKLTSSSNEDSIRAKIGETIVSIIGSSTLHTDILKDPTILSKGVISKKVDKGYAYKIVSIDVVDLKVGKNIKAKLDAERAEAEKQIARAKAEERKSLAIAAEHEMRARTQEKRAELLDAEAELPKALTTAFRAGRIGVMEFYKMKDALASEKKNKENKE